MQTKIDLCSQALLKIGENAITSFTGNTPAAKVAKGLYDLTIDSLLSMHPWRFATKKWNLVKNSDDDFIIPADCLRIISVNARRFEIVGNRIFSPNKNIEIKGIVRVDAAKFPAAFSRAAVTKLAMEFSIPLTGNQNTYALMNAVYENELRDARFIDSSSDQGNPINDFSLVTARN